MKHIITVIDRSGSMSSIKNDMEGGLHEWFETIKKDAPDTLMTVVRFDDKYEVVVERSRIEYLDPSVLTLEPRGATALNDSLMKALSFVKKGEDALVMVVTDGQENASTEVRDKNKIVKRIKELEKQDVLFEYLSASPTAFADSAGYGIPKRSTTPYTYDYAGTQTVSGTATARSTAYLARPETPTTSP